MPLKLLSRIQTIRYIPKTQIFQLGICSWGCKQTSRINRPAVGQCISYRGCGLLDRPMKELLNAKGTEVSQSCVCGAHNTILQLKAKHHKYINREAFTPSYQDGFQKYNCVWTFILCVFGEPVNDLKHKGSEELFSYLYRWKPNREQEH